MRNLPESRTTEAIREELFSLALHDPWNREKHGNGFFFTREGPAVLDFSTGEDGEQFIAVYNGTDDVGNFLLSQTARAHGASAARLNHLDLNKQLTLLAIEDGELESIVFLDAKRPADLMPAEEDLAETLRAVRAANRALASGNPELGCFVDAVEEEGLPEDTAPAGTGYFELFRIPIFFVSGEDESTADVPFFGLYVSEDGKDLSLYAAEEGTDGEGNPAVSLLPLSPDPVLWRPETRGLRIRDAVTAGVLRRETAPGVRLFVCSETRIDPLDTALDKAVSVLNLVFRHMLEADDGPLNGAAAGIIAQAVLDDPDFGKEPEEETVARYTEMFENARKAAL